MPLVIGIDEAGYGPMLGPLVIAATHWRVQPQCVEQSFWTLLKRCVCRSTKRADRFLAVDDSKAVYDRNVGLCTLERAVLAFAHAAGLPTDTLAALLRAVGFEWADRHDIPWYRDFEQPLPLDRARSQFAGIAERLSDTMDAAGVRCIRLRARIVAENHFNQRMALTRNKASIVVEHMLQLIDEAGRQCSDGDMHVHVDRLGGRDDYRGLLALAFPDRHVHVLEVSDMCSRYRLASQTNDWFIDFTVDGDAKHMPIALASMTAKYLREAVMERFNEFWRSWMPTLVPTAGYHNDAQRFLDHIRPIMPKAGLPTEWFVRVR